MTQHDLLKMDFEGILNYFRASLPKKFGNEEEAKSLFKNAKSFQKVGLQELFFLTYINAFSFSFLSGYTKKAEETGKRLPDASGPAGST